MTEQELYRYVVDKKCLCNICQTLKYRVMEQGIHTIPKYKGMICEGVIDIIEKYENKKGE